MAAESTHAAVAAEPPEPFTFYDAGFLLVSIALLVPCIWSESSITGQDEYWLSFRTVLEMQDRGEWLTPYVNDQVRLQKPPLLYWLMRGSFWLLGPTLFAARIWTVLAGAAMALYSARIRRRLFGGTGYLAGLLVLGAAGVAVESRRAMFDLPVGALCTMAMHYALSWHATARRGPALKMAVCIGLAAMTKGPVGLWFFAAPILAAAFFTAPVRVVARSIRSKLRHIVAAIAVAAAVALPWPIWAQQAHPEFWQVMAQQASEREFAWPGLNRVGRLLTAALALCVPWSLIAVAGIARGLRRHRSHHHPSAMAQPRVVRWLSWWLWIGLLPFLFFKSFERYLLALVCPMALLASHWLTTSSSKLQRVHLLLATAILTVPVVLFSLFAMWFALAWLAPLAALLLLVWTYRVAARREHPDLPLVALLHAMLLSVLLGFVYPSLRINALPSNLPKDLHSRPVATFGRPQPGLLSMRLGKSVPQMSATPAGLATRLRQHHGYVFALSADCERLEQAARDGGIELTRILELDQFYSRKAWLKFFRKGARWPEWREALRTRSLQPLLPHFVCYRVGGE
ncbi:MAG: ArnT family glycosyltransferase [Planctomycetota bacterium]